MNLKKRQIIIDELVNDLDCKNSNSKAYNQSFKRILALNRSVAGYSDSLKQLTYSLYCDKSKGAYIWDVDGNKYFDLTMGFGVHLFGHNPDFIINTLKSSLEDGFMLGPMNSKIGELSEKIHTMTNQERVSFFNSGTEAVMVALRLAKAKSKRNKIVVFTNSYHGTNDPIMALKRDNITFQANELIPGIPQSVLQDTYLLDYGADASIDFINKHKHEIGAVLVEPLQSRNILGFNINFLEQLRIVTQECEIPLIFDEIISGFRFANGGIQEKLSFESDITTYGKVLGGGLPIGVVAGKSEYLDYIDGGYYDYKKDERPKSKMTFVAGTFCHHPLMITSALATLSYLQKEKGIIQKQLNELTDNFCDSLNKEIKLITGDIDVVNYGSLFKFCFKNKKHSILFFEFQRRGLYIWEGRNCFLSTEHTQDDLLRIQDIIISSIKKII